MAFLPLIERELRVALRKKRPVKYRMIVASSCCGCVLLFLLMSTGTGVRGAGRELQKLLCLGGAYLALRAPLLLAGVFAEERRNETLGLLFLSGLSAGEIFVSKLFSAAMIAFTGLLASFPVLALPFLLGGVSFDLFLATIFVLPNLLLCALAVTLLASVLTEGEGTATVLAGLLGGLLCAVPALLYSAQLHFSPGAHPSLWWLRLNPAYGPYLVWQGFGLVPVSEFWRNFLSTLCWSLLLLLAASVSLRRLWRNWQENREITGWLRRCQQFVHGNPQYRKALAARWLAVNPHVWLASSTHRHRQAAIDSSVSNLAYAWVAARDRQPATLAWLVLGGLVVAWLSCFALWREAWLSVPNVFITATLLNLTLQWLIRFTAAQGLANSRRDGTFELLLTTPLNPSDIVWGQLEALHCYFAPLARLVFGFNAGLMLAGLVARSWSPKALFVYFVIWAWLLAWTFALMRNPRGSLQVMWTSLNCGRPAYSVWRATGLNSWSWIWILINLNWLLHSRFSRFPSGSTMEMVVAYPATVFFLLMMVGMTLSRGGPDRRERRLVSEFREIVREPVPDPDDPRFKNWDFRERFPWGWAMAQQQLHERLARGYARRTG
jgi:ABC-type transport system involved in multi-copper enzyme maturation permease subunit